MKKVIILCLASLIVTSASNANNLRGLSSHWQCAAHDESSKQWLARSSYKRKALNDAWGSCRSESNDPSTCKTADVYCEKIVRGKRLTSNWQCLALDQMGQHWRGDFHNKRVDAIEGAKNLCQDQSVFPASCYVRLLTCKKQG